MQSSGTRQLCNAISVREIGKDSLQIHTIEKFRIQWRTEVHVEVKFRSISYSTVESDALTQ